jgi:hypothetical protein
LEDKKLIAALVGAVSQFKEGERSENEDGEVKV